MALIYQNHAIISVGMSPQTAHQIELNKPLLDEMMGETGHARRMPFDTMIAPPRAAATCIAEGRYFPDSADDLVHLGRRRRFHWENRGVWYWHMKNGLEDFAQHREAYARAGTALKRCGKRKILAIWSNAQENIDMLGIMPPIDPVARKSDLKRLDRALRRRFRDVTLFCVTRPDRMEDEDPISPEQRAFYYADDEDGTWRGDQGVWSDVLVQALSKTRFVKRKKPEAPRLVG
ncbi:MAG: hypothetical protein AAGA47_05060 [Pseudomonadota bacterium]